MGKRNKTTDSRSTPQFPVPQRQPLFPACNGPLQRKLRPVHAQMHICTHIHWNAHPTWARISVYVVYGCALTPK